MWLFSVGRNEMVRSPRLGLTEAMKLGQLIWTPHLDNDVCDTIPVVAKKFDGALRKRYSTDLYGPRR